MQDPTLPKVRRRLDRFDYFVLAGGLMNVLVISYLVGYWISH